MKRILVVAIIMSLARPLAPSEAQNAGLEDQKLAAYFKGRRTEREARAALKIIKAFVRDRERRDAKSRPPLPGADVAKKSKETQSQGLTPLDGK